MYKNIAFVSDFDGTISFDDFFNYATDKYLNPEALEPWDRYLAGKETHFNALNQIFQKIRVPKEEFDNFIKTIHIDKDFEEVAKLCQSKKIPFYICSAGCDYYIKIILAKYLDKYDIKLITNSSTYSEQTGLVMHKLPENSPFFDEKVGISKKNLVKSVKEEGYQVIFAGDGPPDFAPAGIADFVFARKILLEKCIEAGIKTIPFDGYHNIYNFIEEQ